MGLEDIIPNDYPTITDYQDQLLTACMMGDGSCMTEAKNNRIRVGSQSLRYILSLNAELGYMSNGVNEGNSEGYYTLNTPMHPELDKYDWYDDEGDKVFPDWIELTPTIAKHWYAQDGSLWWSDNSSAPCITCSNEKERLDSIQNLFLEQGFSPSVYDVGRVQFQVSEAQSFLEWIGSPVPGYEYKWIRGDKKLYKRFKSLQREKDSIAIMETMTLTGEEGG